MNQPDEQPNNIKQEPEDLTHQTAHMGATEEEGGEDLVKLKPPMATGTAGDDVESPRSALTPG